MTIALAEPTQAQILCPFCGAFNAVVGGPCGHCATEDTGDTRQKVRSETGPWAVLSAKNPDAPGLSFDMLQGLIGRGDVTERSVVRGPTTGQLWRLASKVRGLSREFGLCYGCGGDIDPADAVCPACDRVQSLPETSAPTITAAAEIAPVPSVVSAIEPSTETAEVRPPRRIPREDLLQPKDIAKAFQLDFGVPNVAEFLTDDQPYKTRRIKIAFGVAGTVVTLALLSPLAISLIGRNPTSPNRPTAATELAVAPARVRPELKPIVVASKPNIAVVDAPLVAPAPKPQPVATPVLASAVIDEEPVIDPVPVVVKPRPKPVVEPTAQVSKIDPSKLWREAIAAERRGDYAAAVRMYRQIESLPGEAWPAQLQNRLKVARTELASSAR